MTPSSRITASPSVGDALERTYEAGQSLVVDRIELLVAEARLLARGVGGALLAGAIAVLGWISLLQSLVHGLQPAFERWVIELAIACVHLGVALALVLRARSRR